MALESVSETVAVLYDIENATFEMLNYALGKARRFQPCRMIVVSDWDARPEQRRWNKLLRRPGFTFRQISRTFFGKNSLDAALFDSAQLLYQEGVRKFFLITTDTDFVRLAESLNVHERSYIIGVGTKQASKILRNACDEYLIYPPEETVHNKMVRRSAGREKPDRKTAVGRGDRQSVPETAVLKVHLPLALYRSLEERRLEQGVLLEEMVKTLLQRGLAERT